MLFWAWKRFYQDRDEIRVMLRLPSADRRLLDRLHSMPIKLDNGKFVPFSVVAEAEYTAGLAQVTRQNREHIQLVSAEIHNDETNIETVLSDLHTSVIPQLEAQFPGLEIKSGQARDRNSKRPCLNFGFMVHLLYLVFIHCWRCHSAHIRNRLLLRWPFHLGLLAQ